MEQKKEQLRARATEGDSEKPLVLICKPVAWRMGDLTRFRASEAGLGDLMNSLPPGMLLRAGMFAIQGGETELWLRIQQLEPLGILWTWFSNHFQGLRVLFGRVVGSAALRFEQVM